MNKNRTSGFALVIVLALLVLVTALVVAFFSRATSEASVAHASTSTAASTELARAALETITDDLRAEIASSSVNLGNATVPVFRPITPQQAVPARVGTADDLPNLVKRSARTLRFAGGNGTARASDISTTTPALGGRRLSAERWNAPRLLATTANLTAPPTPTSGSFIAPDWIYLTRNGTNPATFSDANRVRGTDPVIGRFAYVIYDEGGLLDVNHAGFPPGLAATEIAKKGFLALADLTAIGLSDAQIRTLVNWRNANSAQSPEAFLRRLRSDMTGNLRVAEGDRAFVSRNQLIEFFRANALPAESLEFLGTFSRGLNQPSFGADGPPIPATAAVVPTLTGGGGYSLASYAGNNDAPESSRREINPVLLATRVTRPFDRFAPLVPSPVPATPGEPLVARRFPLDRLAWLTRRGPIAPNGILRSDIDLTSLRAAGLTDAFLRLGTEENIRRAFGLEWLPDPAGTGRNVWVYTGHFSGNGRIIGRLSDAAGAGREPNFFELLKAGIHVGSLAKGAASDPKAGLWQHARDVRTDFHILQLGANLIDQSDADGYPTEVALPTVFSNAELLGLYQRKVRGIENLPYLYGHRAGVIPIRQSVPPVPPALTDVPPVDSTPVTDPGKGALLLHHWVWNPHNRANMPSDRPTRFRVVTFSGDPANTGTDVVRSLRVEHNPWGGNSTALTRENRRFPETTWSLAAGIERFPLGETTTAINFTANETLDFVQPTALVYPGSGVETGTNHAIRSVAEGSAGHLANVSDGSRSYVGTLLGTFPLRVSRNATATDNQTRLLTARYIESNLGQGLTGQQDNLTSLIQYSDGSGGWITFDVKTANTAAIAWTDPGQAPADPVQPGNNRGEGGARLSIWNDPRTGRFGAPFAQVGPVMAGPSGDLSLLRRLGSTSDPRLATARPGSGHGTSFPWFGVGQFTPPGNSGVALTGLGWLAAAPSAGQMSGTFLPQYLAENREGLPNAYRDADGQVRGGMAFHSTGANQVGKPLWTHNTDSRPVILNRPFRTVAEMGYAFRDLPWKQLDFFTPQSGDAALLDVFSVKDDATPDAIVGGRLNLNTRQPRVLEALLRGTGRDPETAPAPQPIPGSGEPADLARLLTQWTSSTATDRGPFTQLGDLVAGYSSAGYRSFFLTNPTPFAGGASSEANVLQRFREAPIRALADVGEVRVWNLFIDLFAQTGRCPPSATSLANFQLEGETRLWIHLAIDRATGKILDRQVEYITR